MPATKIHCDFFEIYGPDWTGLSQEQISCLLERIDKMEMLGDEPELRGFVGMRQIGNTVGGFFAIQYQDQREYYDRNKHRELRRDRPFERLFFLLFADKGKLLLQNRKFADIPLSMLQAERLFREALNRALSDCRIGPGFIIGFYPPQVTATSELFVEEFNRSTRVVHLSVVNPDPDKIPDDFTYYNPERQRNRIIVDSHRHDYANYHKVELEASDKGDIKATHAGRDLIVASNPQKMKYYVGQQEHVLRIEITTKFSPYVDMDASQLAEEQMRSVLDMLTRERALDLESPTPTRSTIPQWPLFDSSGDESEDAD